MRAAARAVAASLFVLMTSSCGGKGATPFRARFAEAQRAESAGRYGDAARTYDDAAKAADRDRDRSHAQYVAALMFLRSENVKEALARLDAVAASPGEHAAEAAYRAASARIDHGDEARGWKEMESILQRFPQAGAAHLALKRLIEQRNEKDERAALEWLRALADSPVGKSELGEIVAYRIAEELAKLKDWAAAHDAYVSVAARWPYPRGALWDDSLYKASEMDEKLGRPAHGIADLERMVGERETTTILGSYQRPRMSPALMRIGVLYRDGLGDRARARAAFHDLYTRFTTSTLRDDALWAEAELWGADGNRGEQCDRLRTLVSDFPDSRFVPCALERCEKLTRPEKSKAPRECRAYVTRKRGGAEAD